MHIAKLGPLKILGDYELQKIRNVRLEQASGDHTDTVRLRFDYDEGENGLGDRMPARRRSASSMRSRSG